MACDDDCARSRLLTTLDEIGFCETFSLIRLPELPGKVVIADAASIYDGIGRQHILRRIRRCGGVKERNVLRQHRGQHSVQRHRRRIRRCVLSQSHRIYFFNEVSGRPKNKKCNEHWEVLLFSQDSVVRLQIVFFEKILSIGDLNVQEGISHAKEAIRLLL
jgi:hypothetical protein